MKSHRKNSHEVEETRYREHQICDELANANFATQCGIIKVRLPNRSVPLFPTRPSRWRATKPTAVYQQTSTKSPHGIDLEHYPKLLSIEAFSANPRHPSSYQVKGESALSIRYDPHQTSIARPPHRAATTAIPTTIIPATALGAAAPVCVGTSTPLSVLSASTPPGTSIPLLEVAAALIEVEVRVLRVVNEDEDESSSSSLTDVLTEEAPIVDVVASKKLVEVNA